MACRSGMRNIIATLRGMCDAGTADVTIAGRAYWTDDQLEDVLDLHRMNIWNEQLSYVETHIAGGSIEYKNYQSEYGNYEETTGGSAIFEIRDSAGSAIATTEYTADYQRGEITFTDDTLGSAYYLTGRSYNMPAAAADIWRRKAGQYASSFSFSTDNHNVNKGQLIQNAIRMAEMFDKMSDAVVTTLYRSDVDATAIE